MSSEADWLEGVQYEHRLVCMPGSEDEPSDIGTILGTILGVGSERIDATC